MLTAFRIRASFMEIISKIPTVLQLLTFLILLSLTLLYRYKFVKLARSDRGSAKDKLEFTTRFADFSVTLKYFNPDLHEDRNSYNIISTATRSCICNKCRYIITNQDGGFKCNCIDRTFSAEHITSSIDIAREKLFERLTVSAHIDTVANKLFDKITIPIDINNIAKRLRRK